MKETDDLWTNVWSKEKYSPIGKRNFKYKTPVCFASCSFVTGAYFKEGMNILDYGCGPGKFSNFLSQHLKNFSYYGIEPNGIYGRGCIETSNNNYGHDTRVKFGFIGEEIEKEAIHHADVALLVSIFTHLTIEQTEQILWKLSPIIERDGIIVFTMILGPEYSTDVPGKYYLEDAYSVVHNTRNQVSELAKKLNYVITLEDEWLSPTKWLHSIYKCTRSKESE